MDFGSRALMREYFIRFVDLSYLLEFMAAESLGKSFLNNGRNLIDRFIRLDCSDDCSLLRMGVEYLVGDKPIEPFREEGLIKIEFAVDPNQPSFE